MWTFQKGTAGIASAKCTPGKPQKTKKRPAREPGRKKRSPGSCQRTYGSYTDKRTRDKGTARQRSWDIPNLTLGGGAMGNSVLNETRTYTDGISQRGSYILREWNDQPRNLKGGPRSGRIQRIRNYRHHASGRGRCTTRV